MSITRDAGIGIAMGAACGLIMWVFAMILVGLQGLDLKKEYGLNVLQLLGTYISAGILGGLVVGAAKRYMHRWWVRIPVMLLAAFLGFTAVLIAVGHPPSEWNRATGLGLIAVTLLYGLYMSTLK